MINKRKKKKKKKKKKNINKNKTHKNLKSEDFNLKSFNIDEITLENIFKNILFNFKKSIIINDEKYYEQDNKKKKIILNLRDDLKECLIRFIKNISFCSITWTLKITINYDYDFYPFPIDFMNVIQEEIKKKKIYSVKNFNNPKIVKGKENTHTKSDYEIQIEGSNINMLFSLKNEHFDTNKMYCNDTRTINSTFGIEAARLCIINEIKKIFDVYGIQIDIRHLSFLADFMTHTGNIRGFNRYGIETNTHILNKMSFETSVKFFKNGCITKSIDHLNSHSSRLYFGKHLNAGTNSFDVIPNILH